LIGLAALVLVSAFLPFAPLWFSAADEVTAFCWALFLAGVNAAINFPFSVLGSLFNAKLRVDLPIVISAIGTIARLLLVYAAVERGFGIVGVSAAALLSSLVVRVCIGFAKHRVAPEVTFQWSSFGRHRARELLHFGKYVLLIRLGNAARCRVGNLLVAPLVGL